MKYLALNVTMYEHYLCAENNKMLMKEIKEDLNKWTDVASLGTQHSKVIDSPQIDIWVQQNGYRNPSKIFL